jgi:hypothetical protein
LTTLQAQALSSGQVDDDIKAQKVSLFGRYILLIDVFFQLFNSHATTVRDEIAICPKYILPIAKSLLILNTYDCYDRTKKT